MARAVCYVEVAYDLFVRRLDGGGAGGGGGGPFSARNFLSYLV